MRRETVGFFFSLPLTDLESLSQIRRSPFRGLPTTLSEVPLQALTKFHFPLTYKLLLSKLHVGPAWAGDVYQDYKELMAPCPQAAYH